MGMQQRSAPKRTGQPRSGSEALGGFIAAPLERAIDPTHGPLIQLRLRGPKGRVWTWGLLDTGADRSAIDRSLLDEVGAHKMGAIEVHSIHGNRRATRYALDVGHHVKGPSGRKRLRWGILFAIAIDETPAGAGVLLGRDFLRDKVVSYDGAAGVFYVAIA